MAAHRYDALDALRGASLLSMAGFHGTWDLIYLGGHTSLLAHSAALYLWQQSICWTFIFLSGFAWSLGRRPLRRGAEIFFCGAAITASTLVFTPDAPILFGILTFLGSAMMLLAPLAPLLRRAPPGAGFAGCALLFVLTRGVNEGVLGFPPFFTLDTVPTSWYANDFTAYLGFPQADFVSLDYFSLVPWLFLYGAGFYAYRLAAARGCLPRLAVPVPSWLSCIGRHSLLFYLLHQPVLLAALFLAGALG